MTPKIKIALLCNNKIAMPAMQRIVAEGMLCAVATPGHDAEIVRMFRDMSVQQGVPFSMIGEKNHNTQLREWITAVQPDIVFVMTFPWRIPADVLAMPRLGFLNFHYGLLPEMRGADPIFESVRRRMPVAGATVHVMDEGLDTGPIVLREQAPLPPEYTYGILSGQVAWLGEKMCGEILNTLRSGYPLAAAVQDESRAKYWPKIGEADVTIRWAKSPVEDIIALVRANNPVSKGAPTTINGWKIGVVDISEVYLQGDASAIVPGAIIAIDQQNGLIVCCLNGKAVKLDVVYTGEGFFPGHKLAFFGIQQGMVFSG